MIIHVLRSLARLTFNVDQIEAYVLHRDSSFPCFVSMDGKVTKLLTLVVRASAKMLTTASEFEIDNMECFYLRGSCSQALGEFSDAVSFTSVLYGA